MNASDENMLPNEHAVAGDTTDTDAFIGDPQAAEEATRARMREQAQREREAGHPVSSDPAETIDPPPSTRRAATAEEDRVTEPEPGAEPEPSVSPDEYPAGSPDTAPSGVPSPQPDIRPVPDVEPMPGVSPDPEQVPGEPTAPRQTRPPMG